MVSAATTPACSSGGLKGKNPNWAESASRCNLSLLPATVYAAIIREIATKCDGNSVSVYERAGSEPSENDWSATSACLVTTQFSKDGGYLGFAGDTATLFVDNVTVKSRAYESWVVEMVENFGVDPNGFAAVRVAHDAAGNMTFDGLHSFSYDAWNRLVEVHRAYANPNDPNDPNNLLSDSVAGTIRYDGLGRRIVKQVGDGRSPTREAGDWEMTYHLYHDGRRTVEERNGSGQVIRQYVWGRTYVDELCQIGINADPADANEGPAGNQCLCDSFYYALADVNWNVIGLVDSTGALVERYEYTPYGRRRVFISPGANDSLCESPTIDAQAVTISGIAQPYGLCDAGHQGLFFDKEWDTYDNLARMLHPGLGRFMQPDPAGYKDGMNVFGYVRGNPIRFTDASGTNVYLKTGNNTWNPINNLIHQNVCVDYCFRGTKSIVCFSFGFNGSVQRMGMLQSNWLGWELSWGERLLEPYGLALQGTIYEADDTGEVTKTKKTTPEEDRRWLIWMKNHREKTTDFYTVGYFNCRTYSQKEFDDAPGYH